MNFPRTCAGAAVAPASSGADRFCGAPRTHVQTRSIAALGLALISLAPATHGIEIPYDHHVPFTPETAIIGHYSASKKPVLTIKSGATVRIDGGGGQRWREDDPN